MASRPDLVPDVSRSWRRSAPTPLMLLAIASGSVPEPGTPDRRNPLAMAPDLPPVRRGQSPPGPADESLPEGIATRRFEARERGAERGPAAPLEVRPTPGREA